MEIVTIAAASANAEPGWGKLLALLIAGGLFWIGVTVHKRVKAVREGREINPFSSDDTQATQNEKTQASTPSQGASTPTRKGVGKWFRKG